MMNLPSLFSSLRARIFLASALLAVFSIAVAIYLVNVRVTREAERTLQREIVATAALVDQLRTTRTEAFTQMARFIADAPKLKAAVDTNDPPTVQDIANGYQTQLKSNLLLVTNKMGSVLATVGASPRAALIVAHQPAIHDALGGHEGFSLLPQPNGMLQLVTVPIVIGLTRPEILGTLSIGFLLDNALAAQLKGITGSDVAFGMDGQVLAATLPREAYGALSGRLRTVGISHLTLGGEEYLALPRSLASPDAAANGSGPAALILRSRTEQLRGLESIHAGLAATAAGAVLLATILSFAVARTITRPLAAITDVMREVARTGDLTRKIVDRHGSRGDEDTRLLAATFNTLTDSIARFQREMSQKERLTALGRLSAVIAHEIRNPLMIIKAALHTLRRSEANPGAMREATADIDEATTRLNRIVNEVLDFTRPIRFELAPVDLNALCRESAAAAQVEGSGAPVHLDLDRTMPTVTADGERLRIALINLLVNAKHAANATNAGAGSGGPRETLDGGSQAGRGTPPVSLVTRRSGDHVTIVIADRGHGIGPGDLSQVFDPFFTTKRGGTGLGLPISKSIVEGLGGTITVTSIVGRGTDIHIELPLLVPTA
jgi:signal transduction histidine kinase